MFGIVISDKKNHRTKYMAKSESAHKYTTAQVLNPLRKPNHFLGTLLISAWTKTRSSNNMASNDAKNKRTKPI